MTHSFVIVLNRFTGHGFDVPALGEMLSRRMPRLHYVAPWSTLDEKKQDPKLPQLEAPRDVIFTSDETYDEMEAGAKFMLEDRFLGRGPRYGFSHDDLYRSIRLKKITLLIVRPETAAKLNHQRGGVDREWLKDMLIVQLPRLPKNPDDMAEVLDELEQGIRLKMSPATATLFDEATMRA